MKFKTSLVAWLAAPLATIAACDSGPCENTRSCGDYSAGGASGGAGGDRSYGGQSSASGGRGGAAGALGDAGAGGVAEPIGGASNAGGAGGEAGGAGGAAAVCDVGKSPSEEPCLVSDEQAVFVAPSGTDKSAGTQSAPLRSIAKAVELATASGKIVIACSARFDESLSLTSGARIYGGFACPDEDAAWSYDPTLRTEIAPLVQGPALSVQEVPDPIVIEDVEFSAFAATAPGGSSIAAVVLDSPSVTLRRVRIAAGAAAAGSDGEKGANGADGDTPLSDQRGGDAVCGAQAPLTRDGGRWLAANACGSRGGAGGQAQRGDLGFSGGSGSPLLNVSPEGVNNGGPPAPATPADAPGGNGNQGSPGKAGASGAASLDQSTFTKEGFTPSAAGGNGADGYPGQGGGGGAASNGAGMCIGASGGAGGMGGCGGKAGAGGASGGASVALLSWDSKVTLDACELVAGNGGAGGKGGAGGAGGLGKTGADGGLGLSDSSNSLGAAGKGGKGGDGGMGGPGAGGNGGPSYALVFHGTTPLKLNETTLAPGMGGAGGPGGGSDALHGANGNAGRSAEQLALTK